VWEMLARRHLGKIVKVRNAQYGHATTLNLALTLSFNIRYPEMSTRYWSSSGRYAHVRDDNVVTVSCEGFASRSGRASRVPLELYTYTVNISRSSSMFAAEFDMNPSFPDNMVQLRYQGCSWRFCLSTGSPDFGDSSFVMADSLSKVTKPACLNDGYLP
jgi:hypothetical protein